MSKRAAWAELFATLLLFAGQAFGQAEDKEPAAIAEIGAAGEWGLHGGSAFGPALAGEVTPIEHWLEIEAGVAPLFGGGHTEWDTDLLFKKPYTVSDTAEFMVGVGPEWVHTTGGGKAANSVGAEAALDFMFWPWPARKFGWYLEPTYGYDFGRGYPQSLAVSVGLLVAIP